MNIDRKDFPNIPPQNFITDCQTPHAELMDVNTGEGWHSMLPMSRDEYDVLTLPQGIRRAGIGVSVTDAYYFRRSPGANADGAIVQREIAGHLFMHCANPEGSAEPLGETGPLLLRVNKYHSLIYEAGREVDVIRQADGQDFVHLIARSPEGGGLMQRADVAGDAVEIKLPQGWELRTETFTELTIIHLPMPTQALFFADGASFQGPVNVF